MLWDCVRWPSVSGGAASAGDEHWNRTDTAIQRGPSFANMIRIASEAIRSVRRNGQPVKIQENSVELRISRRFFQFGRITGWF